MLSNFVLPGTWYYWLAAASMGLLWFGSIILYSISTMKLGDLGTVDRLAAVSRCHRGGQHDFWRADGRMGSYGDAPDQDDDSGGKLSRASDRDSELRRACIILTQRVSRPTERDVQWCIQLGTIESMQLQIMSTKLLTIGFRI